MVHHDFGVGGGCSGGSGGASSGWWWCSDVMMEEWWWYENGNVGRIYTMTHCIEDVNQVLGSRPFGYV